MTAELILRAMKEEARNLGCSGHEDSQRLGESYERIIDSVVKAQEKHEKFLSGLRDEVDPLGQG